MYALAGAGIDAGIVTVNPDAMLDFYRDLLGLIPAGEVPAPGRGRIVKLSCGASLFKLFVLDQPPADAVGAAAFLGRAGLHYVTIRVRDIRGLLAACEGAGVTIVQPLVQPRPDLLAAIVTDPDGNHIELMQTTNPGEGTS